MKTLPLVVQPRSTEQSKPVERSKGVRCGGCGAQFREETWLELALVQRVASEDLRRFLVRWPEGTSLEIRRCRHCGKNVASKVQTCC
jgi:hypothetical protein